MRTTLTFLVFPIMLGVVAHPSAQEQVNVLIRKLGSKSFAERETATRLLKERLDAVKALKDALQSKDAETRTRAAEILEYLDRAPVRALQTSVKEGRVEDFIKLLSVWPEGKHELDAWAALREFVRVLADLDHKHERGKRQRLILLTEKWKDYVPATMTAQEVTELTEADIRRSYFVRAGEVDIDVSRAKGQNAIQCGAVFVVAGNMRLLTGDPQIIIAGGNVELYDRSECARTLIVSAGDVVLNASLGDSLVICRGKVQCNGYLGNVRIIAGKTVTCKREPQDCRITENESHPFGYVQWSKDAKASQSPKK